MLLVPIQKSAQESSANACSPSNGFLLRTEEIFFQTLTNGAKDLMPVWRQFSPLDLETAQIDEPALVTHLTNYLKLLSQSSSALSVPLLIEFAERTKALERSCYSQILRAALSVSRRTGQNELALDLLSRLAFEENGDCLQVLLRRAEIISKTISEPSAAIVAANLRILSLPFSGPYSGEDLKLVVKKMSDLLIRSRKDLADFFSKSDKTWSEQNTAESLVVAVTKIAEIAREENLYLEARDLLLNLYSLVILSTDPRGFVQSSAILLELSCNAFYFSCILQELSERNSQIVSLRRDAKCYVEKGIRILDSLGSQEVAITGLINESATEVHPYRIGIQLHLMRATFITNSVSSVLRPKAIADGFNAIERGNRYSSLLSQEMRTPLDEYLEPEYRALVNATEDAEIKSRRKAKNSHQVYKYAKPDPRLDERNTDEQGPGDYPWHLDLE